MSLRIGVVDYANAAPLAAALPKDMVRRDVPSTVADWLATGEVDLALLPVIELARMPGVTAVPGWGIAADGACDSVFLFARCRLADVRRVTLDASSRTSAALARILLDREGAAGVETTRLAGGTVAERLQDADATLVIGDPALRAEVPEGVSRHDLAAEWKRHVGLPFVFACWASRAGRVLDAGERALLDEAAEDGLSRLAELARAEATRTGLRAAQLEGYLGRLQYRLGTPHWRGLRAFLDEAHRVGVLTAPAPDVKFQP